MLRRRIRLWRDARIVTARGGVRARARNAASWAVTGWLEDVDAPLSCMAGLGTYCHLGRNGSCRVDEATVCLYVVRFGLAC